LVNFDLVTESSGVSWVNKFLSKVSSEHFDLECFFLIYNKIRNLWFK
jgi:hypothetical protein